jgi:tetraacyldisaccharide 4'-kinase
LPIFNSNIIPASSLLDNKYNKIIAEYFSGKTAVLFSGVGDPESFNKTIQHLNINVLGSLKFKDHKKYSKSDIENIRNKFKKTGAEILLTTEKDFLKISDVDLPIYALPISMSIEEKGYQQILKLIN